MLADELMLSTVVGLALGSACALAFGFWVLNPASREMRRGYFNAFVTGLLVAAAIEVIPDALLAIETAAGQLLSGVIPAPEAPSSDVETMWAMLLHPAQLQIAVRALGAAAVMIIFFRANAAPLTEAPSEDEYEAENEGKWWSSLLAIIFFAVAGLACYRLWSGLSGGSPGAGAGALSLSVTALVFTSSFLGIAVLGLLDELRRRWWAVLVAALVIGGSAGVGLMWDSQRPAIEVGLLPLLIGAFCLVVGIGRLLRLLEQEIGLGWRTTLAVAIGALLLYQTRFLPL